MPDYNLGRAHGTIKVDYDGRGVRQADEDIDKLGDATEEAGRKTTQTVDKSKADYATLAAAAKRLEQEVSRAAAAEVAAHTRAMAAQEHLDQVSRSAAASAHDLIDAQRQLTTETKRYEDATMRAGNANRALVNINRQLASSRRPDLTPNVDESKFGSIVRHLQNIDRQTKTSSSFLNTFRSRVALMIAAVALATPTVAGLGVSLVALTGLIGPAAAGIAALAAVAGTLATAFSGIGNVFKAAAQQSASAGASAGQAASQQRAAARQIEQAIRGVRDAEENLESTRRQAAQTAVQAAAQIVQAERQLRDAQFDSIRVQENLTRARRDAARQLEDLRSQIAGGALDEQQAILDVERAQAELNKTSKDPRSSATDKKQALLNLEKQKQALEDVGTRNRRLAEDQADAAAKGVAGADSVTDAERAVIQAREAAGDAAVAVAEAVVGAAQVQIDAQRDIRNATEAVADAQADLVEAYAQAAEAGAAGGAKMADALAKVSPETRSLVKAILAQSSAWQEVKFAVQDALFAGLSKEVAPLANQWLPLLKTGMVGIAQELHGLIIDLIDFLHQGQTTADVATIFGNTKKAVHAIVPAVRDLLQVFLNLATVGSQFLPGMAEGFAQWAKHLADVSTESRNAGTMQTWMQNALSTLGKLWDLLGNVASIIGTVFSAFDQEGGDALTTLVNLTQRLEDFLKSAQGQEILHALGKTLAAIAHLVGDVLIGAFVAFGPVFVKLAPLIQQFADILGKQILVAFAALAPVLQVVVGILSFLGPFLVPLVASFFLLNKAVQVASAVWKVLNGVMKGNPFLAIIAIVIALATLIIENWDSIKKAIIAVWEAIKSAAVAVWTAIKSAIIDPIVSAFEWLQSKGAEFVAWLSEKWDGLLDLTKRAWDHMKSAIIDPITSAIETVSNFFEDLSGKIGGFFADAGRWLFDAGKNIILGLINGLKNVAGKVIDFFKNLIGDAVDAVLDFFGIGSPSKLFEDIGEFTFQGYIIGIDNMEDPVVHRMGEIALAAANAGTPDALVPSAATIPTPRGAADALAAADVSGARTIVVQTLNLTVAGNLDPTDKIRWRTAIKSIKKSIEDVDRSDTP